MFDMQVGRLHLPKVHLKRLYIQVTEIYVTYGWFAFEFKKNLNIESTYIQFALASCQVHKLTTKQLTKSIALLSLCRDFFIFNHALFTFACAVPH